MPRLFSLALLLGLTVNAGAVLDIKITSGIEQALPIAIAPFGRAGAASGVDAGPPVDLAAIIRANLGRSGRFKVMDAARQPQQPTEFAAINFADWRKLGMESLVIGQISPAPEGAYEVRFRLIDIYRGQQIAGFRIPARADKLRRVAHQVSDLIFERLTGVPGAFDTRIAYITVREAADGPLHTLEVADADGHNARALLESSQPLLSPAWSPDGRQIAYVSFEGRRPAIFIQDVPSGRRERIAAFAGINSAPAWSPDGQKLAMTLSRDGNTEIYVMELKTGALRRLTRHRAIDTEPAWSPDGQKLAFTSDRSGAPQIYEIDARGGEPRRVSFAGDYNARPEYAPDGRTMALVHGADGAYRIGLLDLGNGFIRPLSETGLDESPSFAPNGAMIIYATTGAGGAGLAAVSADGRIRQRLGLAGGEAREPAWGPFLKAENPAGLPDY